MRKILGLSIASAATVWLGVYPAHADQLSGKWSGQMHCGPLSTNPDKYPAFDSPIFMVVSGKSAIITRDTARAIESLQGGISGGKNVSLSGEGKFKDGSGQPWITKIDGAFSSGAFTGSGGIFAADGSKWRDCGVKLSLVEPEQPKALPKPAAAPVEKARPEVEVPATSTIPKPAAPVSVEKEINFPVGNATTLMEGRVGRKQDKQVTVGEPRAQERVPQRLQAAFPPGAKLMWGSILCDGRIGEAAAVDPEREGYHISIVGESDFGPFEGREGSIQNGVFKGRVKVDGHDCNASLVREFVPGAVPTGIKSAAVELSVLQKLRSENWTLITNAARSRACDEKFIKQANALMAMGAHLQDNVSNWPKVGSWAATYMKRAPEIVFESGCISQAASQDYEGVRRRREQVFRSIAAGTWICRATLGSREFWEGRRKWVFEEKYVESYLSLPNGNILLIMLGLPSEKILHLEPRMEQRDGKMLGTAFIDMLDAEIIEVNPSSLRFRITKADAGYFPAAGGMVTCIR